MKDAECAETNEKSIFDFYFSSYGNPKFSMKFHDNSKNKNRKNLKYDFSFVSVHSAFFIRI